MKKNVLALLIASSIGLYGCGNESELSGNPSIDPELAKSLAAKTQIKFDLVSKEKTIVTPSFLALDSDGTVASELKVKMEGGDPTDLTNPEVAIGKVDGWGTTMPFNIKFSGDLDPLTVQASFHLIKSSDPTKVTEKAPIQHLESLSAPKDFVVIVSESTPDTLTVVLREPLDPASNYMFAITDELMDVDGQKVGITGSYNMLKQKIEPNDDTKIQRIKSIVHNTEEAFKKDPVKPIDPKKIIFSTWFTTASAGKVISTTKAVIAKTIETVKNGKKPETIWKGEANPNNLNLSSLYTINITEITNLEDHLKDKPAFIELIKSENDPKGENTIKGIAALYKAKSIRVFSGTVNLPYFLSDNTANKEWKNTPWESAVPSLAKIKNIMTNGSEADKEAVKESLDGINISELLSGNSDEFTKLIGLKVTLADGSRLDKERLVTQYSPLPKIKSVAKVPVLLILPPDANPGAVIYQHGITSIKETAYLFAENHFSSSSDNSLKPKAIIAIDHPLHGERHLKDGTVTTPTTADVYMNLEYLTVARDNMRQSIIDDLGLRTSLTVMKKSPHPVLSTINIGDISFFGHSMGAITGIGTYGLGNQSLGLDDPIKEAKANALFNFTSGAFANPGGGIPSLLLESDAFGPTIKHSLLIGAENAAYEGACGGAEDGGKCFKTFFESLDKSTQGSINATFSSFAYAAQTVLDTVDPYHLAKTVNGPVYVMQVDNDSVVPNQTKTFGYFGGTEPLVTQLGLKDLKDYTSGEVKHIARFDADSKAQHSTVIAPQTADIDKNPIDPATAITATDEAQLQVATFTANAGKSITVGNSGIIDPES